MVDSPDAFGRLWADDYPGDFLRDLAELGDRMSGRPGERRAAELVADAFRDAGAREVAVEPFEMNAWKRGSTEFGVTNPVERSFEALALPYSPSGDVHGDIVDVGHGTPEEIEAADVAGNVVVASTETPPGMDRLYHRMEKFGHAVAAGASAFVFANHKQGQLPPTGALRFDREAAVPAVGVSAETGTWLREYADRDGEVSLSVSADTVPGEGHNATGVFGPETDEEVVVLAHHDGHDIAEAALDNGCGVATVVAIARILGDIDLDTRVRVVTVGGEEVGLLGASALADTIESERMRSVVNVDGAGRYRTLRAFTHGTPAFEGVLDSVSDAASREVSVDDALHPFSDHWPFLKREVPAVQLHSVTPERGRGWGHTHADTWDKTDARNVREHGMLAALLVRELTRKSVPRPDADALAADLESRGLRPGMEAAEIWPAHWE
ncbi:M28 family peptidase [Salarchaeum japonicum]|uniref:M28 family peptidase n=1 Tax=Salarchaeum japonicum TaxID=555573 RepID=UPI003C762D20